MKLILLFIMMIVFITPDVECRKKVRGHPVRMILTAQSLGWLIEGRHKVAPLYFSSSSYQN
jgi:hypothetical protein